MKICSSCGEEKPDTEFSPKCGRCKNCQYLENLAWRTKNQEKVTKYNADRYKSNHPGTLEKISQIKEKPAKVVKEKKPVKIKAIRPKSKRVTMTRVRTTETRYIKLVRNDWDKVLSGIKQQIRKWEGQQV